MSFASAVKLIWGFSMLLLLSTQAIPIYAQPETLFADFTGGWNHDWEVKHLQRRPNHFSISNENGNKVLKVYSSTSASGIFRKWEVDPLESGSISWKWKVSTSLNKNREEKTKKGDDFAARVFLLFEPHFFSWRTPNVCYVWAGNEPVGSTFKSPYTSSVCTIVLESGNQKSRQWVTEQRDFVRDYRDCFRRNPKKLSAVAIMVDTDDTRTQTTAWFDDLKISANRKKGGQETK
jgi:hypothetical protein